MKIETAERVTVTRKDDDAWSDMTDKQAKKLFKTFSDKEIRRRQELCDSQIKTAYEGKNTKGLKNLQRMRDALDKEMRRRIK